MIYYADNSNSYIYCCNSFEKKKEEEILQKKSVFFRLCKRLFAKCVGCVECSNRMCKKWTLALNHVDLFYQTCPCVQANSNTLHLAHYEHFWPIRLSACNCILVIVIFGMWPYIELKITIIVFLWFAVYTEIKAVKHIGIWHINYLKCLVHSGRMCVSKL